MEKVIQACFKVKAAPNTRMQGNAGIELEWSIESLGSRPVNLGVKLLLFGSPGQFGKHDIQSLSETFLPKYLFDTHCFVYNSRARTSGQHNCNPMR